MPGTNRAEALRQKLEERSAQVAVVGLGYVGLPLALALTQAGFRVIGIDAAASKVEAINRGVSHIEDVASDEVSRAIAAGRLRATTDSADAAAADVAIIAVPTPIDEFRVPDLSHVRSATAALAAAMKPGSLVVLESTTYPGTTEEVLMPAFVERGFTPGEDLFVGYSPERIDPGNQRWNLHNTPKVVCGLTKTCLELVVLLYSSFVETLVPVSSLKTAEMLSAFFKVAMRDLVQPEEISDWLPTRDRAAAPGTSGEALGRRNNGRRSQSRRGQRDHAAAGVIPAGDELPDHS